MKKFKYQTPDSCLVPLEPGAVVCSSPTSFEAPDLVEEEAAFSLTFFDIL